MALPESFVARWLDKAEGLKFFGHRLDELSKVELIAALVCEATRARECRENHAKDIDFFADMGRALAEVRKL